MSSGNSIFDWAAAAQLEECQDVIPAQPPVFYLITANSGLVRCFPFITSSAPLLCFSLEIFLGVKRQYGTTRQSARAPPPGLDKEISFLFNYNFILCFPAGPEQNKHSTSRVFFLPGGL